MEQCAPAPMSQDAVTLASIPRDVLHCIILRPIDWPFVAATCRALRNIVQRQRAEWWPRHVHRPFTTESWVNMQKFAIFCFLERWGDRMVAELRLRKNVDKKWKQKVMSALGDMVHTAIEECYVIGYTCGAGAHRDVIADTLLVTKRDDVIYTLYPNPFDHTHNSLFSNLTTAVGYAQRALLPCDRFLFAHGCGGGAALKAFHWACMQIVSK
jgi:hypothetical protein